MAELDYKLNLHELGLVNNQKKYGCLRPVRLEGGPYPCGRCALCQAKRRRDWSFRLGEELRHCISSYFVTMTYSDENLPYHYTVWKGKKPNRKKVKITSVYPTLNKEDYQLFLKTLRNNQVKRLAEMHDCTYKVARHLVKTNVDYSIRYYMCGEYGENYTRRPHYHMLLFNVLPSVKNEMGLLWKRGTVKVGTVTPESINYVTKYMLKQFGKNDTRLPPYSHMSTRPAIGYQYLELNKEFHQEQETLTVRNINGNFQAMPRFYRDRIWLDTMHRKAIIEKTINEFRENQNKEIERLSETGQLTPDLELSKIRDVIRRKEAILNRVNTF